MIYIQTMERNLANLTRSSPIVGMLRLDLLLFAREGGLSTPSIQNSICVPIFYFEVFDKFRNGLKKG